MSSSRVVAPKICTFYFEGLLSFRILQLSPLLLLPTLIICFIYYFLFTFFDLFFKGVRLNAVDKPKLKDNYKNNERSKNNEG